ncbi:HPP family protein [Hydrogenovibrio crunogenus]|uniref:HPP family protein n=1 Tax=Hydrogenovibrio crunogenus TaxID=39765 RepID=A0A4P7P1V7_9GAMM|nr:HPP family protein [Hydrogenovibrio crunogenus]QBZ83969.1 HPP family protein [Hydrogenovibrio crunogenus]
MNVKKRHAFKAFWGLNASQASHHEKLVSALGGFLSILLILLVSRSFLELSASVALVASMGASAVLLFAVPHGPLSQPWPLLGGNLISAFIGVTCAQLIDPPILAASTAVGLAILAMYYFKCIHPPGGATALTAAIGGESIHALGYQFVITPVLLNVLCILMIAIIFNAFFHWRRYPAALQHSTYSPPDTPSNENLSHEDFIHALKEIDSFVDINEHDLKRIFELANLNANATHLDPDDIQLGEVYSNGKLGKNWSMRQVIDESRSDNPAKDYVIFKQIAGQEKKTSDCITRAEFARWAQYPMIKENGLWHRKSAPNQSTSGAE